MSSYFGRRLAIDELKWDHLQIVGACVCETCVMCEWTHHTEHTSFLGTCRQSTGWINNKASNKYYYHHHHHHHHHQHQQQQQHSPFDTRKPLWSFVFGNQFARHSDPPAGCDSCASSNWPTIRLRCWSNTIDKFKSSNHDDSYVGFPWFPS